MVLSFRAAFARRETACLIRKPMSEYARKRGDRVGPGWRIPVNQGKRAIRYVSFDANQWKTFALGRWRVAIGDPGCFSVFGRNPDRHRLWAEHMTAEYPVEVTARGRTVKEWKSRPNIDNHWFDCDVGCAVAASMEGITLDGIPKPKRVRKRRVKLSELRSR